MGLFGLSPVLSGDGKPGRVRIRLTFLINLANRDTDMRKNLAFWGTKTLYPKRPNGTPPRMGFQYMSNLAPHGI